MRNALDISDWDLDTNRNGVLTIGGCNTVELAREFGTPLHVVNASRLQMTAETFYTEAHAAYPGKVSVHYPFKCNSVPGIVDIIHRAGLKAEVMTEFELDSAQRLGFRGEEIIVNGPCKTEQFLRQCIASRVRLIIVDSLEELQVLHTISESHTYPIHILLRVNPDYTPKGMNEGSATGSRKGCALGFDLKGGEITEALTIIANMPRLVFKGFHFHIGTGIRHAKDYARALRCLTGLIAETIRLGASFEILDVGGGFASPTSREFTAKEMLMYQAFGKLPVWNGTQPSTLKEFIQIISNEVQKHCTGVPLPELIFEPGRCITSSNQMLLLTIQRIKKRKNIGTWIIADGGLSTVTLPTYYEYHELFLCNDIRKPRREQVTIIGPACFAGDVIYRNKLMPEMTTGDIIALMDTGAYFTAMESSFGYPHPAIVTVSDGAVRLVRQRESFHQMTERDVL